MHSLLRSRRLAGSRGFTIVELMIVLLIIGVLLALGLAKFAPAVTAAKSLKAQAQVANALKDAGAYYTVNKTFDGMTDADLTSTTAADVNVTGGGCDQGDLESAATENTLDACVDDQEFTAVSCDHTGNAWTVTITDGEISGPTKAAGACGGGGGGSCASAEKADIPLYDKVGLYGAEVSSASIDSSCRLHILGSNLDAPEGHTMGDISISVYDAEWGTTGAHGWQTMSIVTIVSSSELVVDISAFADMSTLAFTVTADSEGTIWSFTGNIDPNA